MKRILFLLIITTISNFIAWNWCGILIFITFFCLFQIFEIVENYNSTKSYLVVFLFFFLYNFSATYWLANFDLKYGILANFANSIYLSLSYLVYRFSKLKYKFILFLITYILLEINHLYWFLNWGWLDIGNVFGNQPIFIQWYKYSNLFFGSFWVLFTSYLFSSNYKIKYLKFAVFFIPIIISILLFFYSPNKKSTTEINTTLISPKYSVYNFNNLHRAFYVNNYLDKIKSKNIEHYIFLPEIYFQKTKIQTLDSLIRNTNHTIISGIELIDTNNNNYNAFFVKHKNEYLLYKKDKFVPVTEYVPTFLNFVKKSEYSRRDTDNKDQIKTKLPFDVLICYESIFNQVLKNCEQNTVFVLASEFFMEHSRIAHNQYNNLLRVKAIEFDKQIIKVSFEGDNIIINPRGEIIHIFEDEFNNIKIKV